MTRQGAAETPQTAPPDASRAPRLSPLCVGAHSDAPHPRDSAGAGRGADKRTCRGNGQTLTYIAPARPEAAEETPEELTVDRSPRTDTRSSISATRTFISLGLGLVYHEARGESFEGQVAVVEVVLNRMLSDYFPDTVEEVVFQKYGDVWQFSPGSVPLLGGAGQGAISRGAYRIEERDHILSEDTVYFSTAPYNESVDMIIGNHYFCKIF